MISRRHVGQMRSPYCRTDFTASSGVTEKQSADSQIRHAPVRVLPGILRTSSTFSRFVFGPGLTRLIHEGFSCDRRE